VRDFDWISRHIEPDDHAVLTDVSALYSVLSVMGPKARELLARVSPDDLSPEGLKFSWTKEIDLGHARVRAARMSYVGGPGFELYVPIEMARHVYLALHEPQARPGLERRRLLRAGRPAHRAGPPRLGRRAGPDETPWEAGLAFSVKLDKPADFIGKPGPAGQPQGQPLRKKLVTLVFDDPQAFGWGGEPIVLDGETVGEISSVGWSPLAGACVALGYVRGAGANQPHAGTPAHIELWGERVPVTLHDRWPERTHEHHRHPDRRPGALITARRSTPRRRSSPGRRCCKPRASLRRAGPVAQTLDGAGPAAATGSPAALRASATLTHAPLPDAVCAPAPPTCATCISTAPDRGRDCPAAGPGRHARAGRRADA
jgi:hypothetical protein